MKVSKIRLYELMTTFHCQKAFTSSIHKLLKNLKVKKKITSTIDSMDAPRNNHRKAPIFERKTGISKSRNRFNPTNSLSL